MMKKTRLIITGISAALIIVDLFFIDYEHFLSRSNLAAFLGIFAMVFNIVAMILSNRHEERESIKKPGEDLKSMTILKAR